MLTVPQFIAHIQETVFPQAAQKLQQCADPQAVASWKRVVCSFIKEKSVAGEPPQEFEILGFNPQDEERKENLTMPQRVYLEAEALVQNIAAANISYESDAERIKQMLTSCGSFEVERKFAESLTDQMNSKF
jgi:hypothetical protein